MKIQLFFYPESTGDGGVSIKVFTTPEARDAYEEAYRNWEHSEPFCDCDGEVTVEVDAAGNIQGDRLNPVFSKSW